MLVQMLTAGMKHAAENSNLAAALDDAGKISARLDEQIAAIQLERRNTEAMNERIQAGLKAAAEIKRKAETKQD